MGQLVRLGLDGRRLALPSNDKLQFLLTTEEQIEYAFFSVHHSPISVLVDDESLATLSIYMDSAHEFGMLYHYIGAQNSSFLFLYINKS